MKGCGCWHETMKTMGAKLEIFFGSELRWCGTNCQTGGNGENAGGESGLRVGGDRRDLRPSESSSGLTEAVMGV